MIVSWRNSRFCTTGVWNLKCIIKITAFIGQSSDIVSIKQWGIPIFLYGYSLLIYDDTAYPMTRRPALQITGGSSYRCVVGSLLTRETIVIPPTRSCYFLSLVLVNKLKLIISKLSASQTRYLADCCSDPTEAYSRMMSDLKVTELYLSKIINRNMYNKLIEGGWEQKKWGT